MTINIKPAKPTDRPTSEVEIDGKVIGRIEPYEDSTSNEKWHAVISLKFGPSVTDSVLIQGIALTHEEAVADAIKCGMEYHEHALVAIRQFRMRIHDAGD